MRGNGKFCQIPDLIFYIQLILSLYICPAMINDLFSFVIWNVSPEIFHIGGLSIRWYGLLFAMGFLIGQQILIKIYTSEGRSEKDVETLTIYMVIATVVGARLGHVLFYQPDYYLKHPLEIIMIWKGGLASHGAAIGILIAIYIYSKKAVNQSYLYVLDRMVITIALAGALIRLGNLMNSEIIGLPSNAPTAFVFDHESQDALAEVYSSSLRNVEIKSTGKDTIENNFEYAGLDIVLYFLPNANKKEILASVINNIRTNSFYSLNIRVPFYSQPRIEGDMAIIPALGVPRHPSQLYESISYLIIFFILLGVYRHFKGNVPEGRIFSLFIILVFGMRFLIEFIKEPQVEFEKNMTLNMGQLLSIPLVLAGLFILMRSFRKKNTIS